MLIPTTTYNEEIRRKKYENRKITKSQALKGQNFSSISTYNEDEEIEPEID